MEYKSVQQKLLCGSPEIDPSPVDSHFRTSVVLSRLLANQHSLPICLCGFWPFSHLRSVSGAQSLCFCHLPVISKTPHYCFQIEQCKTICTPSISTGLSVASQREMWFPFAFITITVHYQYDTAFGKMGRKKHEKKFLTIYINLEAFEIFLDISSFYLNKVSSTVVWIH